MFGAPLAAATARSIASGVTDSPAARPTRQPFCAPLVRSRRVSLRVSMSAMPTVPSRRRYSGSVSVARKLEAMSGRSRMIRPAAWTLLASTSSSLTP